MGFIFYRYTSQRLKIEFPNVKEMPARNLRYMQKFAKEFDINEFLQGALAKYCSHL